MAGWCPSHEDDQPCCVLYPLWLHTHKSRLCGGQGHLSGIPSTLTDVHYDTCVCATCYPPESCCPDTQHTDTERCELHNPGACPLTDRFTWHNTGDVWPGNNAHKRQSGEVQDGDTRTHTKQKLRFQTMVQGASQEISCWRRPSPFCTQRGWRGGLKRRVHRQTERSKPGRYKGWATACRHGTFIYTSGKRP